jgi:hypothetical protein
LLKKHLPLGQAEVLAVRLLPFRIFNVEFEVNQRLEDLDLVYLHTWDEAKRADAMVAKQSLILGETLFD